MDGCNVRDSRRFLNIQRVISSAFISLRQRECSVPKSLRTYQGSGVSHVVIVQVERGFGDYCVFALARLDGEPVVFDVPAGVIIGDAKSGV
jgi:hypothetical protein